MESPPNFRESPSEYTYCTHCMLYILSIPRLLGTVVLIQKIALCPSLTSSTPGSILYRRSCHVETNAFWTEELEPWNIVRYKVTCSFCETLMDCNWLNLMYSFSFSQFCLRHDKFQCPKNAPVNNHVNFRPDWTRLALVLVPTLVTHLPCMP